MKISIVTATYNSSETILDNINCINDQTYFDWEHIIIDGKSKDDTLEKVRANLSKKRIVLSEPDTGPLEGMNKGIKLATGEIVGFLNSDDIYFNSKSLATIAKVFENPKIMGCYGDLVYTKKEDLNKIVRIWSMGEYSLTKLKRGWTAAHPTFYIRKNVFEKIGFFDPYYFLQSDFEFVVRFFLKYKYSAKYIPVPLVKMRSGGISNNSLKNIIIQNLYNYRALTNHGAKVTKFYPAIRILSRFNQYLKEKLNEQKY